MNFRIALLTAILVAGSNVAMATTYPLGEQDPSSSFVPGGQSDAGRGWEFQVNAPGITVTQLGMNDYGSGTYEVDLFDVGTQTVLASSVFDYTAGDGTNGWAFQTLGSPVPLTEGADYLVELYTESNSTYYFANPGPAGWLPTGNIQYLDMLYCNDCGPGTYPTLDVAGSMYGIPDIGFDTAGAAPAVPEPASFAILGAGLAGVSLIRRRKRA